jgi:hypothetical protein
MCPCTTSVIEWATYVIPVRSKGHLTLNVGQVIHWIRIYRHIVHLTLLSKSWSLSVWWSYSQNQPSLVWLLIYRLRWRPPVCASTELLLWSWVKVWNFECWLVTSRKINLQSSNDSLIAMMVISRQTIVSKEAMKPVRNASATSSPNVLSSQSRLGQSRIWCKMLY